MIALLQLRNHLLRHVHKLCPPEQLSRARVYSVNGLQWEWPGVHKTGIRGIQDTRQIVDGKTNDIENNDKKGGSKPLT